MDSRDESALRRVPSVQTLANLLGRFDSDPACAASHAYVIYDTAQPSAYH